MNVSTYQRTYHRITVSTHCSPVSPTLRVGTSLPSLDSVASVDAARRTNDVANAIANIPVLDSSRDKLNMYENICAIRHPTRSGGTPPSATSKVKSSFTTRGGTSWWTTRKRSFKNSGNTKPPRLQEKQARAAGRRILTAREKGKIGDHSENPDCGIREPEFGV